MIFLKKYTLWHKFSNTDIATYRLNRPSGLIKYKTNKNVATLCRPFYVAKERLSLSKEGKDQKGEDNFLFVIY